MFLQTRLVDLLTEIFTYQEPQNALNIISNSMPEVDIQYGVYNDDTFLFVEDDMNQQNIYTSGNNPLTKLVKRRGKLVKEPSKLDSLIQLIESAPSPPTPTGNEVEFGYTLLDEETESVADYVRRECKLLNEKAEVDLILVEGACDFFTTPIPS